MVSAREVVTQRTRRFGEVGDRAMQPRDNAVAAPTRKTARSGTHRVPIQLSEAIDAQATLARRQRAYYELFEGAPVAYLVTDPRGVITHVNRQACVLLNAGARLLVGKTLTAFIARADRPRFRDLVEVMSDVILHTELRVQPRAEETCWVAVVAQRATSQDGGACVRWLMRSTRTQKQEEARRDAATDELQARILELEAHGRRVGHFLKREQEARRAAEKRSLDLNGALANVAHHLAGPLRSIQAWLMLVDREPLDPRARKQAVANAGRSVQDLMRLAEQLRDHARVAGHHPMLNVESIDLARVVASVMEELRVLASDKGICLELAATAYGLPLRGDPVRLRHVFRTLLDNAIDATPEGGHVRIAISTGDGHAQVVVSDTGRGIEPGALATLFEPFTRARKPAARSDGLGLGLSVARHLIELHGGSIEAHSAGAKQGASFCVRLPL
jgi:PAS domain S-box-containing protein